MKRKCAKKKALRNGTTGGGGGVPRDAVLVKTECEAEDVCTREDLLDIRIKEEPHAQEIDDEDNGHSDTNVAASEVLYHHELVKVECDEQQQKQQHVKEEPPGCCAKEEQGSEEEAEEEEVSAGRCNSPASHLCPC